VRKFRAAHDCLDSLRQGGRLTQNGRGEDKDRNQATSNFHHEKHSGTALNLQNPDAPTNLKMHESESYALSMLVVCRFSQANAVGFICRLAAETHHGI
jgi:hypothetical protein